MESLLTGCLRIVTDKPFTPAYFLDVIRLHKVSHVFANSSHIAEVAMLKDVDKSRRFLVSINSIMVGGTKVPVSVQKKMHKILSDNLQRPGLVVVYGLSELGGMLSYNGKYLGEHLLGSEGKLVANKKVKIVNKKDELLGPNDHGEICILMTHKWSGYYRNEEATERALRGNWLYTGDIGYFNDEGFLHVCTRSSDIFKSRNFHVYPQILEDVIEQLPGISEVCVIGIPDAVATHLPACAVVTTTDDIGMRLRTDDIVQIVKKNTAPMYHLSGGVYFVDALPKTGTGKIQRSEVLRMIMEIRGM